MKRTDSQNQRSKRRAVFYPAFTWDYTLTGDGKHGFGVLARHADKKGEKFFSYSLEFNFSHILKEGDYLLFYGNDEASKLSGTNVPTEVPLTHDMLRRTHGVPTFSPDPTGESAGIIRWVFEVPGMFMNHSCSPTEDPKGRLTRDVEEGEEITCDYALALYDQMPDEAEIVCRCGSPTCRGQLKGFKYLSNADKEKLLPMATEAVQAMHKADMGLIPPLRYEPVPALPERPPQSRAAGALVPQIMFPGPGHATYDVVLKRNESSGEYGLYALKDFNFGERVYYFWAQPWPSVGEETVATPLDIVFATPTSEHCDPKEGEIIRVHPELCAARNRAGEYMFSGWELLAAHSCEPNLVYATNNREEEEEEWKSAYAARNIKKGELLALDYNCLLWDRSFTAADDVGDSVRPLEDLSECHCGSSKCVGTRMGFKFLSRDSKEERKMMSWKRLLPPYRDDEEQAEAVTPGEALAPWVRLNWRRDPESGQDAPDTDNEQEETT